MTLPQLHEAIKPQFVWMEHNCKDLQTDAVLYKGKGSQGIASIVFIGISFMNGFKPKEVCEYLNIEYGERGEYFNKLGLFKKAMQAHAAGKMDKQSKIIYLKTGLTLNHLRLKERPQFVPINSFKF